MSHQAEVQFVQRHLGEWLKEAKELRQIDLPGPGTQPQEYYEALLSVRARLDRLEELLADAIGMAAGTKRAMRDAKDAAEDAWDTEANRSRSRPVSTGRDFEGARERYADWNLAILPARQAERHAVKLADMSLECVEKIRLMYSGLNGSRADLVAILHGLRFESHLER